MPVHDTHDKNGKIPKSQLPHILELVAIRMNSLGGCLHYIDYHKFALNEAKKEAQQGKVDVVNLINIYSITKDLVKFYETTFAKDAKDLYEFFYQTSGFDKHAYYACQFPIDWEKFKKKRVDEKIIKKLLRDKNKNAREIVEFMHLNKDVFLKSLTIKIRSPKFEKPFWYKDKD